MISIRDVRPRPRRATLTAADVDALIPPSPPPSFRGAWAGWYLRTFLWPFCGEETRAILIGALGPGADYEPIHYQPSVVGGGRRVERW